MYNCGNAEKKFSRHSMGVRIVGAFVSICSCLLIIDGLSLLLEPSSAITENGASTHALSAKLFFTLVSVPYFCVGLVMFLCPRTWIYQIFARIERIKAQQRVSMDSFDKSFNPK